MVDEDAAGGVIGGEVSGSVRRAAVLGSPVEHSRSPQLHLAAYRALGLDGWTYERIECDAEQLPGFVRSRGPEWAGLSVTMPGKVAALDVADSQSDRALLCGSANTLVHTAQGWHADCTDIDGVRGALLQGGVANLEGASAVVLGAGGTARPAVYALAELGVAKITIVARDANRARTAIELSAMLGMPARVIDLDEALVAEACASSLAVVNTMPATAAEELSRPVSEAPFVLDAIYDPWPTPLASAVTAAGGTVVSGLLMLLNQAYGQVEQFTGMPAPREAMADALSGVSG